MRALTLAFILVLLAGTPVSAITTIPQSALIPSTTYYTDVIGGGIGPVAVMTDGGSSPGIGNPTGRNDDGFQGPINLGFNFTFFGNTYTQFFANNNGNISFNAGIASFTPTGPTGAAQPIISPFFADVDTRNDTSGVMHVRQDITNELIVTWDAVGYFNSHADKLNSFQLVVRGPGFSVPAGEGTIGFFYKGMQWETGDVSGGVPAAVGFGNGAGDGEVLQGSTQNGIAAVVNNHHIWFDVTVAGVPIPAPLPGVPEPASLLLLGSGLAAVVFSRLRRRA